MNLSLALFFVILFSSVYTTITGMTIFNSEYKIDNTEEIFFNASDREDIYNDYIYSNFYLSIVIILATIIFIIAVTKFKVSLLVLYIYCIFMLFFACFYFGIIGALTYRIASLDSNYFSRQSIMDFIYSFLLLFLGIIILVNGKTKKSLLLPYQNPLVR